jgi:hypothetical protein
MDVVLIAMAALDRNKKSLVFRRHRNYTSQ